MSFLYGSILWLILPLIAYAFKSKNRTLTQQIRWIVLALLVVALARPILVQSISNEKVESQSLVIALDLSFSMRANDIKPSRAEVSKNSIKSFLDKNKNDQIALIGFTINPLLLSPPTTDHNLVKIALDGLKSDYILTKGTDLKRLFEKISLFSEQDKRVILFTDGGDEPFDEDLVEYLQEQSIKLLAIGVGSKEGSTILKKDGEVLEDSKGNIVVSKLNSSLKRLAVESGGEYIEYSSNDKTVTAIEQWVKKQNGKDDITKESRNYFDLAFLPILLALILFFISSTKYIKYLFLLLALVGINLQAEEILTKEQWGGGAKEELKVESSSTTLFDGYYLSKAYVAYKAGDYKESFQILKRIKNRGFEAELLLAHIYYKREEYKKAKSILKGMRSSNIKVKQQLLYELGNCEAKLAYWEKAKSYYVKALQLGVDEDALHNLAIVVKQKERDNFKTSAYNPSSATRSKNNNSSENLEESNEEKSSKSSKSDVGTEGGDGSKKSKQSVVKVVKSQKSSSSKRVMSSKAYDLINSGYIREEKPW